MNRNLVTQTALQPVQSVLNAMASNLAAHANASLTKAHGFSLLQFAPGSVQDGNGNDVSVYYDDHGDVIGNAYVVFILNNESYYAPANITALAGQSPNTGKGIYGADSPLILPVSGSTAWITDILSQDTAAAEAINAGILLPHAQKGYWEVHGPMSAYPFVTLDSLGHVVGTYVVQLVWGGSIYQIPCSNQLGGITQAVVVSGFSPSSPLSWSASGPSTAYVRDSTPIVVSGSLPITFSYQYWNGTEWDDFNVPSSPTNTTGLPYVQGYGGNVHCYYNAATGQINFRGDMSIDNTASVKVWLTVTNATSSTSVDWNNNPLILEYITTDTGD
jgi:hypothetical protein